jgi:hypothetical protein
MVGETAKHSPTRRGIVDLAARMERLEAYERWRSPTVIDFETVLGKEQWKTYWQLWEAINNDLRKCQDVADDCRAMIAASLRKQS